MYCLTQEAIIHRCIQSLLVCYRKHYSHAPIQSLELLRSVTHLTLRKITQSNAPYHNLEHTVLVTLTGQAILEGKFIQAGHISSQDWLQTIISLLCHDIGYVKGICNGDSYSDRLFTTATDPAMLYLPPEATDASLAPYHVDRGKCFVEETLSQYPGVDVDRVKHNIELTRFPVPADRLYQDTIDYPGLVRAADLIGQLADPKYLQKTTALFQEFEEVGIHQQLGYQTPEDLRLSYPEFFWTVVYQYIQTGLQYLEVTMTGQKIINDLHRNLFQAEAERRTRVQAHSKGMAPTLSLLKNVKGNVLTSSLA
ncbi:MAG: metal-dependent phosphohydrolase [Microcoleaceae cyanobacterium]